MAKYKPLTARFLLLKFDSNLETVQGDPSRVGKVERLMKEAEEKAASKANGEEQKGCIITINDAAESSDDQQIHSSPKRLGSDCESVWVCIDKMCLHVQDKDITLQGLRQTYECHSKAL